MVIRLDGLDGTLPGNSLVAAEDKRKRIVSAGAGVQKKAQVVTQ